MPPLSSESEFRVSITGDRLVEYSEPGFAVNFSFDLNLRQGPKSIFLESKPFIYRSNRIVPIVIDQNRFALILSRVVDGLHLKGYKVTVVPVG